jgi:hypothetical protein
MVLHTQGPRLISVLRWHPLDSFLWTGNTDTAAWLDVQIILATITVGYLYTI